MSAESSSPSHMSLTVATEMVQQSRAAHRVGAKELCFEQYSCAEVDVPFCRCTDGKKVCKALLRTNRPIEVSKMIGSFLSDHDWEIVKANAMHDLLNGKGSAISNLHVLEIYLPHQDTARRYFTCSRKSTKSLRHQCKYVNFWD